MAENLFMITVMTYISLMAVEVVLPKIVSYASTSCNGPIMSVMAVMAMASIAVITALAVMVIIV